MDGTITTAATVGVLAFMAIRLGTGVRIAAQAPGRARVALIVRRITWRHVAAVPVVLAAVVIASSLLVQVPGLHWGWWSALGGEGNPVFGSSEVTAGSAWEWILPLAFMVVFLPALPLFAYAEERAFRRGAEAWSVGRRAVKVLAFGLVHALIGIPIGVALALSIGGVYFMWVYLREHARTAQSELATVASAAAHTAYNGIVVGLVLIATVVDGMIALFGSDL